MGSFKDLRIVDNFYQTSSFFPMPTVLVGTVSENGKTNLGSYSLCFPYYIAGKDYYAMILECRNSSNTAQNILRGSKVSLNFIPDDRKFFREAVRLGFPGMTTDEKMKDCLFNLEKGIADGDMRPLVVSEAFQVFECSWDSSLEDAYLDKAGELEGYEPPYRNFNGITSKFGAHFILKIDKILMKERYCNTIINGVSAKGFPDVPVDYGYRDSTNFWCSAFKKPFSEKIQAKDGDVESVKYAAKRIDPNVSFTDEACAKLTKIPRVFLKAALTQMVDIAKQEGISVIDEDALAIINDKRRQEKKK